MPQLQIRACLAALALGMPGLAATAAPSAPVPAAGPAMVAEARSSSRDDERVRTLVYRPDEVTRISGAYGYALSIEFAEDETVASMSIGDSVAWQVVPRRNVLFLKPQEDKAETNLLVHTNKRVYSYSLIAFKPTGPADSRLTYRVRYRYPDDEARALQLREVEQGLQLAREMRGVVGAAQPPAADAAPSSSTLASPSATRARNPAAWNFNYTFKGSRGAAPLQMLDDGEFTYVRFANNDAVPAIFMVDAEGQEVLINFRREGQWLVIERIAQRFTFRAANNTEVACIYNEGYPARQPSTLRERS